MTSANKKPAYYDFKHSYQYPMSHGTPMEITSNEETKSEKKSAPVQTWTNQEKVWNPKDYIPPHLCQRKKKVQRQKYHFKSEMDEQEASSNTYSL